MTDKINRKEIAQQSRKKGSRSKCQGSGAWQAADATRLLFKGQCYDAGPDSETKCGVCGERVRLCYVLKVLDSVDPLAPEVAKLTIGECCFQPIKAINEKLYRQLLAAAINLRTFLAAVQRDTQIFADGVPDEIEVPPLPVGADEDLSGEMLERSIAEGGDHA